MAGKKEGMIERVSEVQRREKWIGGREGFAGSLDWKSEDKAF